MTPHQQQLIADNEAKRKEMILVNEYVREAMMLNARGLFHNGLITIERYQELYHAITDKYNAIEKTIKENKE